MRWKLAAVRAALAAVTAVSVLSVAACGRSNGVENTAIDFQPEPVNGVPVYPGGAQLTGNLSLSVPVDMRQFIGENGHWSAYRTGDAIEDIAFYYLREMERLGYAFSEQGGPGVLAWSDGEHRYAVHVVVQRVQNHIILASTRQ